MKILIISGSTAKLSHTRTFLKYIEELLKKESIETSFWDLGVKPLQIAIPEFHMDPLKNPDPISQEFLKEVISSDGYILGSPVYHGSFSGVLKNALDQLHPDAFRNKPVGLVSNGYSIRNSTAPCDQLRVVVRALYGYALQSQIGTTDSDFKIVDDKLVLENEDIKNRAERFVDELIKFSSLLKSNNLNKEN